MLVSSFHWNDVFNVHKWFVPIPQQFFHNHHNAGHAEQRLQPIYLHTDIPEVQTSVSESDAMLSFRSHSKLGNDCGLTELLTPKNCTLTFRLLYLNLLYSRSSRHSRKQSNYKLNYNYHKRTYYLGRVLTVFNSIEESEGLGREYIKELILFEPLRF